MVEEHVEAVDVDDIDPFLLSLIVNKKTLMNCTIDLGASNTIMLVEIMESFGLKVDTKKGRCCAIDSRQVSFIGTINSLP